MDGAGVVGEDLDLHVARALDVALAVERTVGERARRLALGGGERFVEVPRRADDAHPAPAASGRRLDEERESDLVGRSVRQHRDSRLARDPLRRDLVRS